MQKELITKYLGEKKYPGRTIAIAVDPRGETASIVYFIMGRSENSQNRIFVQEKLADAADQGIGIVRTQAYDPEKIVDPSLIIYPVYQNYGKWHILTNGDQTTTIYEGLKTNTPPAQALLNRECEPDSPNFTPRISLITDLTGYELNLIKAASADGKKSLHFDYRFPYLPGHGHCIHTYFDEGEPLPSYSGEPFAFEYCKQLGEQLWRAINPDFKISLLECVLDLQTNKMRSLKIFNKHHGD